MKILKFGAIWCKECIVMRPMWEEIEEEMPDLKTEYFDADEQPDRVKEYGVANLPTFIFLDNNEKEIARLKGAQNKDKLIKLIKENIDK